MRRRVFPFFFPPVSVGLGKSNKHTHTLIILCKVGLTTLIGTLWKMKRTTTVCCISLCSCTEKAMELKKMAPNRMSDRFVVRFVAYYVFEHPISTRIVNGPYLLLSVVNGMSEQGVDTSPLYFYRPPPFDRYMSNDCVRTKNTNKHTERNQLKKAFCVFCVFCFLRGIIARKKTLRIVQL